MDRQQHDRLIVALDRFKRAAAELSEVWQAGEGDEIVDYPRYLPSFDEFAAQVQSMDVRDMPAYVVVDSPELEDRFAVRRSRGDGGINLEFTSAFCDDGSPDWQRSWSHGHRHDTELHATLKELLSEVE